MIIIDELQLEPAARLTHRPREQRKQGGEGGETEISRILSASNSDPSTRDWEIQAETNVIMRASISRGCSNKNRESEEERRRDSLSFSLSDTTRGDDMIVHLRSSSRGRKTSRVPAREMFALMLLLQHSCWIRAYGSLVSPHDTV